VVIVLEALILARHAHATSNAGDIVNAVPPGGGLSVEGTEEARALGRLLAGESIDLGVSSRLLRTQETLALALTGRGLPTVIEPLLDEIGFGSFEGCPLAAYRTWAWEHEPDAVCPGGGESRVSAAGRFADGLVALLARPEATVLAVGHALPLRYVLDAADGIFPAARVEHVPHATPYRLERESVERAAETLQAWATAPRFANTPFGG
jgi:broad specificity phosphatase PhoE